MADLWFSERTHIPSTNKTWQSLNSRYPYYVKCDVLKYITTRTTTTTTTTTTIIIIIIIIMIIIIIIVIMFVSVRNLCLPNPCKNGGKCNRKGYSYSCSCAKGYTGKKCEGTFNLNRMLV
jgi:hypothetical protein